MNADLSRLFVATDKESLSPRPKLSTDLRPIDAPHDGEAIFAAVMKWAAF
jgi:hypothetical protein